MVVGSVEVDALPDAIGDLGKLAELYPDVPALEWAPYRELYPAIFAQSCWRLPVRGQLVRAGGRTLLVDTGLGASELWEGTPEEQCRLVGALAEHGVEPDGVDVVLLTHLHVDHVGGATDDAGEPVFPRARYLISEEALDVAERERSDRPHIRRAVLALRDRGVLDVVEPGAEPAPGLVIVPLPGHDPGHVGVRIESRGRRAVIAADAAPHPALLDRPEWRFLHDADPAQTEGTRRSLVAEAVDEDVVFVCGHYPGSGIGRVARRGGRVVWEAVDL